MGTNSLLTHRLIPGLVFLHLFALCLYVLPVAWVPEGLRVLAVAYVRPLFHQQWQLFAPDPPLCSCEVQVSFEEGLWRSLHPPREHYLEQRMVQNMARHVQAAVHDEAPVHPLLKDALVQACSPYGDPAQARFRLMEHCVIDPEQPADRELRISPIDLP